MFARLSRENPPSIPADEALANSRVSNGSRRKSKLTTAAEVAGIVGALTAIAVGVPAVISPVKDSDHTNHSDTSITAPTVSATPANTINPDAGSFEFEPFDDFTDSTINPEKWTRGKGFDGTPPLIYAQGGLLHMQVTKENGSGENAAVLQANLARPARAISFEMTLLASDGANDGGGYAVVSSQDSRNHKLLMGPSGDGFPVAGYDICNTELGATMAHTGTSNIQEKIDSSLRSVTMCSSISLTLAGLFR